MENTPRNTGLAEYLFRILVRLTRVDDDGKSSACASDLQLAAKDLALNFAG